MKPASDRRSPSRRLYVDTSAYLCVLLAQDGSERLSRETDGAELMSSVILVLEARRNLVRLAREGRLQPEQYQACTERLDRDGSLFVLRDLTLDLCQSTPLPAVATPRSLDLAHLQTALWFHAAEKIDRFVTLDLSQKQAAKELGQVVIRSYKNKFNDAPAELFIHGRVRFGDEEWSGFRAAVGSETKLVGVRIREEKNLKLYRKGQNPVLRGTAHIRGKRSAHLWSRGWTPRLQTYPGREVPNPIVIEISKGEALIEIVVQDILALTKLNYNACIFGDGMPITLKFADAIGEILTAAPLKDVPPLPFSNYI